MDKLLITNARILDPSCQPPLDFVGDILVEGERIVKVGAELSRMEIAKDAKVIDAAGLCAAPGFIDIHVHLRDPGFTHKEDILTGCQAAAAGGVTSVCCMPNTKPVTDSEEVLSYILNKAKDADARVYPIASITKGMHGEELNDFAMLHACGAAAVSDDGRPVENAGMMLEALKKAYRAGVPVVSHCEDLSIIDGGIINKGKVSEELGVRGMDRASEDSITVREIVLAESSDTAIHIAHVSTKGSVQLIREAKARGVKVTCETAPHYMMMTDELLRSRDANFRMNPPLREEEDCEAIIEGIFDGTIDAIVTDHAVDEERVRLRLRDGGHRHQRVDIGHRRADEHVPPRQYLVHTPAALGVQAHAHAVAHQRRGAVQAEAPARPALDRSLAGLHVIEAAEGFDDQPFHQPSGVASTGSSAK